ncbi:hypothetical protein RJ55_08263 [Drechmeria coniospora]|nr:hypothetical protein RJ55_08263 [Drechmeria coniospora]
MRANDIRLPWDDILFFALAESLLPWPPLHAGNDSSHEGTHFDLWSVVTGTLNGSCVRYGMQAGYPSNIEHKYGCLLLLLQSVCRCGSCILSARREQLASHQIPTSSLGAPPNAPSNRSQPSTLPSSSTVGRGPWIPCTASGVCHVCESAQRGATGSRRVAQFESRLHDGPYPSEHERVPSGRPAFILPTMESAAAASTDAEYGVIIRTRIGRKAGCLPSATIGWSGGNHHPRARAACSRPALRRRPWPKPKRPAFPGQHAAVSPSSASVRSTVHPDDDGDGWTSPGSSEAGRMGPPLVPAPPTLTLPWRLRSLQRMAWPRPAYQWLATSVRHGRESCTSPASLAGYMISCPCCRARCSRHVRAGATAHVQSVAVVVCLPLPSPNLWCAALPCSALPPPQRHPIPLCSELAPYMYLGLAVHPAASSIRSPSSSHMLSPSTGPWPACPSTAVTDPRAWRCPLTTTKAGEDDDGDEDDTPSFPDSLRPPASPLPSSDEPRSADPTACGFMSS